MKPLTYIGYKIDNIIDTIINGSPYVKVTITIWVVIALIVGLFVFE